MNKSEQQSGEDEHETYGEGPHREIPISFDRRPGNEVVVTIGCVDDKTTAETKMTVEDAKLAIPRLIDELGAWGEFDAP